MDAWIETSVKWKAFFLLICIAGMTTIWTITDVSTVYEFYWEIKPCGCEKCITQDHPWFMKYYQKSMTPLLTSDYELSQEDFDWWKKLQSNTHDREYFKSVTKKIFKEFPGRPPVPAAGPDRCHTCAVVGNSGNLKGSHYGKLIDNHNSVFRINFGKTKGFEEDVGRRTTHRVMYPESASDLDNSTHLVLFPFRIMNLEWLLDAFTPQGSNAKSYTRIKKTMRANKNLVMVLNPAFMKYTHQSWLQSKGRYPSTGFMTVILALHICDEVSVFGFGADSDGKWTHYWDIRERDWIQNIKDLKTNNLRTGPHPGSAEIDIILELAKQGKITFHGGW